MLLLKSYRVSSDFTSSSLPLPLLWPYCYPLTVCNGGFVGVKWKVVEAVTSFVATVFAALGARPNVTANVNGMCQMPCLLSLLQWARRAGLIIPYLLEAQKFGRIQTFSCSLYNRALEVQSGVLLCRNGFRNVIINL